MSARRFQAIGVMKNAIGTLSASAASSSRNAASERAATLRPAHEFSVARHRRSTVPPNRMDALHPIRSQPRGHLQRFRLDCPFGLEQLGQQESKLDRLLGIETRVAQRVIAVIQILIADRARATGTFGDVLAGHLQMYAAAMRALGGMDREEDFHFLQDAVERPR